MVREPTMSSLIDHFEKIALVALEKQDGLFSLLGEYLLDLDIDKGIARFSDAAAFPYQMLGTESENSLTWLWAWADEQPEVPEELLRSVRELKAWGAKEGVSDFAVPSLDLNRADGTMISMIASMICAASGYYRDPYDGGSLFILLYGADSGRPVVYDRAGLIGALSELRSRYDFDHRKALCSYFRMKDLPFTESGDTVNAELAGGERLIALFDHAGQLTALNGEPLPWQAE